VLLVDDEKRDPPLQCAALPFVPPSMLDPSKALEESGKILNFLRSAKMGAVAKVFGWKSGRSRFSMGEVFEKKRADFGDRSAAKENEKKGRTQFLDRV
jgi:hypothetical protein